MLYNVRWISYPATKEYRTQGHKRAAKYGVVGVLLRWLASFSISYLIHEDVEEHDEDYEADELDDYEVVEDDRGKNIFLINSHL